MTEKKLKVTDDHNDIEDVRIMLQLVMENDTSRDDLLNTITDEIDKEIIQKLKEYEQKNIS